MRIFILRHLDESFFSAGITPQGFYDQHSPLTLFRKVEVLTVIYSIALQTRRYMTVREECEKSHVTTPIVMWPARLVMWPVTWPASLVTWPQYNWSRDQALAIEYLACAFFIIKLKVEGNLKCGYNAQYHFQCKVAIKLGSFESFILLCSWSQWRRSMGWTCNDHLKPRFDEYIYYFENLLE